MPSSDEEEELDGGALDGGAEVAKVGPQEEEEEEEEMDGGALPLDVAPDLFSEADGEYMRASTVSEWLPPGREKGRVMCTKRGTTRNAGQASLQPPPPPKRGAPEPKKGQKSGLAFVAASASDAELAATSHGAEPAPASAAVPPPPPQPPSGGGGGRMTAAERMMSKMGYKEGGGLGKDEQGRTAAVEEHGNMGSLGLGFQRKGDATGWKLPTKAPPLGPEELDPCPVPLWMAKATGPPPDAKTLQSWLVEGARIETIDHETEHVEPAVLASMLRAKTMLDDVTDRRAFNDARTRANPFEAIKKEFFLNRAALKMAAMDAAFELIFSGADNMDDLEQYAKDSLASAVAAFTESHTSATYAAASRTRRPPPTATAAPAPALSAPPLRYAPAFDAHLAAQV